MNKDTEQIVKRYSQWFTYLDLSRIDSVPIFIFDEKKLNKLKYCEYDLIKDFDGKPSAIRIYKDYYTEYTAKKLERILKTVGLNNFNI